MLRSYSSQDSMRPQMRRKSSAGNLLSQFKPTTASINGPTSQSAPLPGSVLALANPVMYPSSANHSQQQPNGTHDSAASTPTLRDWDVQSASGHSEISPAPTTPFIGSASTTVEALRDLIQKRIMTLTYLRNTHEGKGHWFGTILSNREDLDKVFNNTAMKKRTHRFATLGMSLAALFDIHPASEYLRAVISALNEFDQFHEDNQQRKQKKRILFRTSKMPKRGMNDYSMPYPDSESSYLVVPQMPFNLDYHQTLISFLDIVTEVYQRLHAILGPSPMASLFSQNPQGPSTLHPSHPAFPPNPSAGLQMMMGPLGMHSPHPGLLSLFSGVPDAEDAGDGSLWALAGGSHVVGNGIQPSHSPPPPWGPALGDTINKIDLKFKKIIMTLVKEMDAFVRNAIKDELASLDPLLKNMSSIGDSRERDNVFEAAEGPWGV